MASFSAGTTFTDGVANDVTAAKLAALVNNATPTSGLIQDRTAETITATNDTLLIGDASDSTNLKRITVANFAQTLPTAKVTTGTIDTATLGTTTGTAATFTTLTAGTTTSTAATITSGTIPTLTAGTTTGTAASFSGDLTIADKIVHSGDTNTAIRFPAADTVTVETAGTERVRVDSSGNVGIGTNSPSTYLVPYSSSSDGLVIASGGIPTLLFTDTGSTTYSAIGQNGTTLDIYNNAAGSMVFYTNGSQRLRIDSDGDVSIGTATALSKLHVHGNITLSNTTTATSAGTGGLSKPATYAGYLTVSINGTSRKIPYYAT